VSDTKTIEEWEQESNLMVRNLGKRKLTDKVTKQEFFADHPDNHLGVRIEDRKRFLEANGYQVTRENMMDSDLSAEPARA